MKKLSNLEKSKREVQFLADLLLLYGLEELQAQQGEIREETCIRNDTVVSYSRNSATGEFCAPTAKVELPTTKEESLLATYEQKEEQSKVQRLEKEKKLKESLLSEIQTTLSDVTAKVNKNIEGAENFVQVPFKKALIKGTNAMVDELMKEKGGLTLKENKVSEALRTRQDYQKPDGSSLEEDFSLPVDESLGEVLKLLSLGLKTAIASLFGDFKGLFDKVEKEKESGGSGEKALADEVTKSSKIIGGLLRDRHGFYLTLGEKEQEKQIAFDLSSQSTLTPEEKKEKESKIEAFNQDFAKNTAKAIEEIAAPVEIQSESEVAEVAQKQTDDYHKEILSKLSEGGKVVYKKVIAPSIDKGTQAFVEAGKGMFNGYLDSIRNSDVALDILEGDDEPPSKFPPKRWLGNVGRLIAANIVMQGENTIETLTGTDIKNAYELNESFGDIGEKTGKHFADITFNRDKPVDYGNLKDPKVREQIVQDAIPTTLELNQNVSRSFAKEALWEALEAMEDSDYRDSILKKLKDGTLDPMDVSFVLPPRPIPQELTIPVVLLDQDQTLKVIKKSPWEKAKEKTANDRNVKRAAKQRMEQEKQVQDSKPEQEVIQSSSRVELIATLIEHIREADRIASVKRDKLLWALDNPVEASKALVEKLETFNYN